MAITATEVNELRKLTGAGMMDCKKALTEAEGDIDKAIEILRKKGQKVSASRAEREAKEGAVFCATSEDGSTAAMIEMNCETDFVARNDDFQGVGNAIVKAVLASNPADISALNALSINGKTALDLVTEAMGRIGEKIEVSKFYVLNATKVVPYIHPGAKVGVLVAFEGNGDNTDQVGKDVAMQIAAMKPIAIDKDDVPAEVVNRELEVAKELTRAEGKPEAMVEKIAMGRLGKFFAETTLLNQEFVKDSSKTIGQYLKEANPNVKIKAFRRIQLGEA